jgi:hypothetical protein
VDGCEQAAWSGGLCEMHRWRVRTTGEPGSAAPLKRRTKKPRLPCSVDGCERPRKGAVYCHLHSERIRLTGSPGPAAPRYEKGVVKSRTKGYKRIVAADGRRIMEHVDVMERHLGRHLDPHENIHHRNGIRDDNRLENLELWVKVQPRGQRAEDLIRFVVEHYPAEVRKALGI